MKSEEATQGKQTVLQWRKLGKILTGKFLPAGLQPGQQTGLPQVSANDQNNIKLWKTSDREQREETDSWKEASGLPFSLRSATGVQHCADLTQNWPRNIQVQVGSSWTGLVTSSLMVLMIKQCFVVKTLLFSCPEAFQVLNPAGGGLFYYSWSTESFHTEKSEWSKRSLPPN